MANPKMKIEDAAQFLMLQQTKRLISKKVSKDDVYLTVGADTLKFVAREIETLKMRYRMSSVRMEEEAKTFKMDQVFLSLMKAKKTVLTRTMNHHKSKAPMKTTAPRLQSFLEKKTETRNAAAQAQEYPITLEEVEDEVEDEVEEENGVDKAFLNENSGVFQDTNDIQCENGKVIFKRQRIETSEDMFEKTKDEDLSEAEEEIRGKNFDEAFDENQTDHIVDNVGLVNYDKRTVDITLSSFDLDKEVQTMQVGDSNYLISKIPVKK